MSADAIHQLDEWEDAIGMPRLEQPAVPTFDKKYLWANLLEEEFNEYIAAIMNSDIVEVADALADMEVVIRGTARLWGIDLDAALAEVHRSNMTKIGPNGEVLRRADGKVIKPETYEKPQIARVLGLES